LRGALAIRNTTGVVLHVTARVVDAELGPWRTNAAAQLAGDLDSGSRTTETIGRELGRIELVDGETRLELLARARPRPMRSVLVYDPIGTRLDTPSPSPARDPSIGTQPLAGSDQVIESFEIARDEAMTSGLPGGPVRLLERRGDGSLAVLGTSRMFDPSARAAASDTIAVASATGVTGHRTRREYTIDEDAHRLVEEFVIAIDNHRPLPASVLIREHLYRGQDWTIGYYSTETVKEGPQQIALRVAAAAGKRTEVMYVVVYTWP
jgi:hypothetical protein